MNLPILKMVECKRGYYKSLDQCIRCKLHLSIDPITDEIQCDKKRKEAIKQTKKFYNSPEYKNIEFGVF
jgi:hypothetical protein